MEQATFCEHCLSKISFIRTPLCPTCGRQYEEREEINHLCGDCLLTPPPFSKVRYLGRYEGLLMEVIHRFKYRRQRMIGVALGRMMARFSYPYFTIADYDLIIPVPLHLKRLKERTFNQAMVLAKEVAHFFSLEINWVSLERCLDTPSQVNLSKEERRKNVRGAFSVTHPAKIKGKKILLIDDVYTTGSTVSECARLLLKNGAAEVGVLTVART